MKIGIPIEVHPSERRVAATPATVDRLVKQGFEVLVESGAGESSFYSDEEYVAAKATIVANPADLWKQADVIAKVRAPAEHPVLNHEADHARPGQVIISLISPGQNKRLLEQLAAKKATVLALDCIPRITRAQSMDVLSSMANIAGYRAVIEAAANFGSFFTGQHTAAGSVPPAKVLIIGAGVAGLAAIAAARGLGAIVRAFDTRAATKEQVESLGGEFLTVEIMESGEGAGGYAKVMSKEFIEAEMALFLEQAKDVDIVITTALIPGKTAPVLWTEEMVKAMKSGSVVVDLAAEQGGNCELTQTGRVRTVHGVVIVGFIDMTSRMAHVSSDLFGTNLTHLTNELGGAENFNIDHDNEVLRGALVLDNGELMWPPPAVPRTLTPRPPPPKKEPPPRQPAVVEPEAKSSAGSLVPSLLALALVCGWVFLRTSMGRDSLSPSTAQFLQHLTVFTLACFVGWQVIWNVTPALHTPLMSVTNAISGIIIVGGLLQGGAGGETTVAVIIGAIATLFATINIFGGFLVTQRMLQMFHK